MTLGNRYIFVHIPKTAGLSIRKLFEATFGEQNVSQPFNVSKMEEQERARLDQFQMISGHISGVDLHYFPDRQLITFLRDPIDRCLSIYSYYRNHEDRPLTPLNDIANVNTADEAISLARQMDPGDFFASDHPHVVQNIQNRMVWQLGIHADHSYRTKANADEVLQRALANIRRYFFVGFYEDLANDIRRLQAKWNVTDQVPVPSVNRTSNRVQRSDLSAKALDVLRTATGLDQRLYDTLRNK